MAQRLETIHNWHVEVQQNQCGAVVSDSQLVDQFFTIGKKDEITHYPRRLKRCLEKELVILIVFSYKDGMPVHLVYFA
jgi:hypothetical protein